MSGLNVGILAIFGMGIVGGTLGARLFQKLRVPQVVGYIAIGLLLGRSGVGVVKAQDIEALQPFNLFALGVIGFLVGGELRIPTFRKYGRQFAAILLGEGVAAFLLVGASSTLLLYGVTGNWTTAAAAGIVFGAIASATDPASTVDVLWEYRSAGVLTTALIAIVALDDALAMTLYGLGTSAAQMLTSGSGSLGGQLVKICVELLGALALGGGVACILTLLLRWIRQKEKAVALSTGFILLSICVAVAAGMDVILATMALGFTLVNLAPRRSKGLLALMRSFSTPIYVLFFVLVGARLRVAAMPGWLWGIVAAYVVARTAGKMGGAYMGARIAGSAEAVRRYMGLGLFAQGGVAVGLSIMAGHHLGDINVVQGLSLGDAVVFGVTATTLIVQVLGPPMVKLSIRLADEIGRNVTEEDVVGSYSVRDVMTKEVVSIPAQTPLRSAVQTITSGDNLVYPVVAAGGEVAGMLSLESLKEVLTDQDSWDWLVAADVMSPVQDKATPDEPLRDVLSRMRNLGIEQMPVVAQGDGEKPVGMADLRRIRRFINNEMLRRRRPGGQAKGDASPAEG